ncbi:MAG: hypothetical protein GEV03_20615 [Streptosporangiales bacterium]|nr:hypothetical protein [Streptosporangiales bacterium]
MARDLGPRRCSVGRALGVFSDPWTFMVLREAFFGVRRFEDFQHNLSISRNVLTKRLKHLVDHGIFERRPYQSRPPRHEYRLTEKGTSMYSIMVALMAWGDRWLDRGDGPPLVLVHERCRSVTSGEVVCVHCGEPIRAREMHYMLGPGSDPDEVAALAGGLGTYAVASRSSDSDRSDNRVPAPRPATSEGGGMARSLGTRLPEGVVELLNSSSPEGPVLLLLSTDEDGWPRQAMLSLGELVVVDDRHLRLGLWSSSTTTRNLTARGRATLTAVLEGTGLSIRLSVRREEDLTLAGGGDLACFTATVEEVTADEVPYAELTSGVTFRLRDRDAVQRRWTETRAALREVSR